MKGLQIDCNKGNGGSSKRSKDAIYFYVPNKGRSEVLKHVLQKWGGYIWLIWTLNYLEYTSC